MKDIGNLHQIYKNNNLCNYLLISESTDHWACFGNNFFMLFLKFSLKFLIEILNEFNGKRR